MPITNLHRLITHQQGWLNTSRSLAPEDLEGRILLLDFWTFCCINCMHVIPDLQYLEEKFGDKLTVIGVHSAKFKNERDSENIRQAILRYGIHHAVVNDFDFTTWQGFSIRAWPTFVLINPRGTVETMYSGEGNRATAERDIAALIKKYDGKINTAPLPIALEADKQPPSVLRFPGKLSASNDQLALSDSAHQRIVLMDLQGKIIQSIGSGKTGFKDGSFTEAEFNTPQGVLLAGDLLYIADTNNHALRIADLKARTVTTLAGTGKQGYERDVQNGAALSTPLASPWDLAFYPDEKHIAIAMAGTHQLWSYDIAAKTVSVLAGNGSESIDDGKFPYNSLSQPSGLSALGGKLYFVDSETSSLRVFENGAVKTLIGTGLFDFGYKEGKQGTARMQHPLGVFADASGVYVADSYNHSIRRFDPATGLLSNFAGHGERGNKDGALAAAEFNEPNALALTGDKLYVADTNNNAIRIIDLKANTVSTLTIGEVTPLAAAEFSDALPNVEKTERLDVSAGASVTIAIAMQSGWHINKDAPSNLALFDKATKAIATFDREAVKQQKFTLPPLAEGTYRLQGTLYYCEDKEGAQCLVKSFDMTLTAKAGGKKEIELKLN